MCGSQIYYKGGIVGCADRLSEVGGFHLKVLRAFISLGTDDRRTVKLYIVATTGLHVVGG